LRSRGQLQAGRVEQGVQRKIPTSQALRIEFSRAYEVEYTQKRNVRFLRQLLLLGNSDSNIEIHCEDAILFQEEWQGTGLANLNMFRAVL
jgi:hypothetical protein